jgi:hypothetical protein
VLDPDPLVELDCSLQRAGRGIRVHVLEPVAEQRSAPSDVERAA